MTDYAALNAMVRRHKAALTRATKKGPQAVIAACDAAFAGFETGMWPDDWSMWQRAKDDATFELRRASW